jgi:diguanylate cyclase (GGDEF)-like protein
MVQYVLFTLFCYIWSGIYNEYARSEEENNILIDRLGDKYVQLELAKKEIQNHYEKQIETNNQLEEANKKLTASLAEFYTLQQISQAITSIFDMNELLKFVNDVIIGVMGAAHSTIALCYGPQNKLKVQVSSIFDKKDLAIVSDYINCDILKPSTEEGHSMIDNAVNEEDYPFTKGRNIKAMICVPLLAKGRTLGIVLIEHSIKDAFDDENMRLLEVISQQVSIAIENARLYQQMHDLATLDNLTGAYNRLYFNDKLQEEFKKAQEGGHDLSFIILDIDHYKKFNDTYGHLFGDLVLKTLSGFIMKTLRKEDVFARYGGEEFVILMPYTSLEQAKEKAEDLRIGVSQLSITDRVVSASITISIGVSTFPETAGRSQELIRTADDALYEAKRAGRNLVRVAKARNK